jgi:membrane protein YdbS with pleckstrin-like domain
MKPGLTEDDIVNRVEARVARPSWLFVSLVLALIFSAGLVFVFIQPVNHWLHVHKEFVLGVLVGSVLELVIVFGSRWAWDRVLWMKWFSHQ